MQQIYDQPKNYSIEFAIIYAKFGSPAQSFTELPAENKLTDRHSLVQ